MNLISTNPAYIPFRLRGEFLLYLDTLIEQLNQSGWRVRDTELEVESYGIEQRVITKVEKKREREDERRELNDDEKVSARFYEQNPAEDRFETIRWSQAISQNKRLAIKGSPGSGKTFSTKATVIQKARDLHYKISSHSISFDHPFEIPIWITAKELAASGKKSITDALITILGNKVSRPGLKDNLFCRWLRTQIQPGLEGGASPKRLFIVVDALDELTKKEFMTFSQLAEQLDRMPGTHLVTTCRTLQWESRQDYLNWKGVVSLELAILKRSQKNRFIQQFFRNEEMRQTARMLMQSNPAVELATDSPLFLTFACFLHLDGKLNENSTYIDIYKHAQRRLFEGRWKPVGERPRWSGEGHRELQDLENIALELFRANPESNHFTLVDWDDACGALKLSKTKVDRLRSGLIQTGFIVQSGIEDRSGDPCWSFLHRTLLEFSAARALVKKAGWLAESKEHFWDFAWTETLVFLAGLLDEKAVMRLIKTLRIEQKAYKKEIFGWLTYLEVRFTGVSELYREDSEPICDKIIYGLAQKYVDEGVLSIKKPVSTNDSTLYVGFLKLAYSSLNLNSSCRQYIFRKLFKGIIISLQSNNDKKMRKSAAEALGELECDSPEVNSALITCVENDKDESVRTKAMEALRNDAPDVIAALVNYIRNGPDDRRHEAAFALRRIGRDSPDVIAALIKALHTDWAVAYALSRLGNDSPEAVSALITSLQPDIDESIRSSSARALGELHNDSPEVIRALINLLQNDADENLRQSAAEALGSLGNDSAEVITALVNSLQKNLADKCAVEALGALGNDSPEVITTLIDSLINHKHVGVRGDAALALGILGKDSSKVIAALLHSLHSDDNFTVREDVLEALGELGNDSDAVIAALINSIKTDPSFQRRAAVLALGKLGNDSDGVISILIESLHDRDDDVRRYAAWALGELEELDGTSKRGILALLRTLHSWEEDMWGHLDRETPRVAALALGRIYTRSNYYKNNPTIQQIVSEIRSKMRKPEYILDSAYARSLFQIWQAYRTSENNLTLTWDMLKKK